MNYRFLNLAKLSEISQLIKVAVSKDNEELREGFRIKFPEEPPGKVISFADQWYQAFHGTQLYRNWENLETLDKVLLYIKENKNLVSRETAQFENKNFEYLNNKYPELKNQISQLNPQFLSWLNSRFGENPEVKEVHPIGDCLTTLLEYQEKLDSLKQKFNENQDFKNLIIQRFGDINIGNIKNFTVDQMETIMALSERKKGVSTVIPEGYIPKEYIGKFGEWNLWMPLSREDSVAIPCFDPDTLEPHTTWCTARTYGSNLFYSYSGAGVILFYVIRDDPNPEDDNSYQSIGWIGGEVKYNGNGTETVNRANIGMYKEDHRALFGSAFDAIYGAMQKKVEQLGGQHPVAEKFEKAALGDQEVYQDLIRGVEPDGIEAIDEGVRDKKIKIAKNSSTPPDILRKLSGDEEEWVREGVAGNPSTPQDILREFFNSNDYSTFSDLAQNPSTPTDIIRELFEYEHDHEEYDSVMQAIASNPSTPPDILRKLSESENEYVMEMVARNTSTPPDILKELSKKKLIDFEYNELLRSIRELTGSKSPTKSTDDRYVQVRKGVAQNPSTPPDVLWELSRDEDIGVRGAVATNRSATPDILWELSGDLNWKVRAWVAKNPSTPLYVLEELSKDQKEGVRRLAKEALEKLQEKQASTRERRFNKIARYLRMSKITK